MVKLSTLPLCVAACALGRVGGAAAHLAASFDAPSQGLES